MGLIHVGSEDSKCKSENNLAIWGSITVRMISSVTGLDSVHLSYYLNIKTTDFLFARIQSSQTDEYQLYSETLLTKLFLSCSVISE